MPRCARVKIENGIYHIICRSISEVKLFKSVKDKIKYMELIKRYKEMYDFKLYAYCLMGNHLHFMIDANGADVSKVMHGMNLAYARYYNRKYDRHGHLFQDRFKSKIVDSEGYMRRLAVYIHHNPTDFKQYSKSPEKYNFSSLGIYMGLKKDKLDILDTDIVMGLFGSDTKEAIENHYRLVMQEDNSDKNKFEFKGEKTEYRSYRKAVLRNYDSEDIIKHVFNKFGLNEIKIHLKHDRVVSSAKALAVMALRKFGGKKDREIANLIGDITQARISQLCFEGINLIKRDERSREIIRELIAL